MSISESLLTSGSYWFAVLLGAVVLMWAAVSAPWTRLRDNTQIHVWLGTCVALMVVWSIHPTALVGLDFHLLGATAFALMFGLRLSIVGFAIVLCGLAVSGQLVLDAIALDYLLLAVLPALVSTAILHLVERMLPRNFFVYVFVIAFFGAAVSVMIAGTASTQLVATLSQGTAADMAEQFLPFVMFLAFAEATLTGMLITLMVVYRPHWVATFDDAQYLRAR